jgi:cyclohexyl-isocyanide hydratase
VEIGFLLFPNSAEPDLAGPSRLLGRLPDARVHLVAENGDPVAMDCGCSIKPTARFADAPDFDAVCIPGGSGVTAALQSPAFLDYLSGAAAQAALIGAIGTGAFLLGGAGLLVGKRATTHPAYASLLADIGAEYRPEDIVTDGNVLTCHSAEAATEFALAFAEAIAGATAAERLRNEIAIDPAGTTAACERAAPCMRHAPDPEENYGSHFEELKMTIASNILGIEYTL